MGIGLYVGDKGFEIGTPDFLNSLFSTVCVRLENGLWGSRYRVLMNKLYAGEVQPSDIPSLEEELRDVRHRLSDYAPNLVVWDFENRNRKPPWGDDIDSSITSLANYFWTSDGKDLFDVMTAAADLAKSEKRPLSIAPY